MLFLRRYHNLIVIREELKRIRALDELGQWRLTNHRGGHVVLVSRPVPAFGQQGFERTYSRLPLPLKHFSLCILEDVARIEEPLVDEFGTQVLRAHHKNLGRGVPRGHRLGDLDSAEKLVENPLQRVEIV